MATPWWAQCAILLPWRTPWRYQGVAMMGTLRHGVTMAPPWCLYGGLQTSWCLYGGLNALATVPPSWAQTTMAPPCRTRRRLHGDSMQAPIEQRWRHGRGIKPSWLLHSGLGTPWCRHDVAMVGSMRHGVTMVSPWWPQYAMVSPWCSNVVAIVGSSRHGTYMADSTTPPWRTRNTMVSPWCPMAPP